MKLTLLLFCPIAFITCNGTKSSKLPSSTYLAQQSDNSICRDYGIEEALTDDIFKNQAYWFQEVDQLDTEATSSQIIANYSKDLEIDGDVVVDCAMPYNVIHNVTPTVKIQGENGSGLGPDGQPVDGDYTQFPVNKLLFPIQPGMREEISDFHLLIVDPERKSLYELYKTREDTATGIWYHQGAAKFNLNKNEPLDTGCTISADAAGLPVLPGLLRFDELNRGEIGHALRMTVVVTKNSYVSPAAHCTTVNQSKLSYYKMDPNLLLPMGARLRVRSTFDDSNLAPAIQKIIRCLKKYGVIIADNGSNFNITATDDCKFNNNIMFPGFRSDAKSNTIRLSDGNFNFALKYSDFQVVKLGTQKSDCLH